MLGAGGSGAALLRRAPPARCPRALSARSLRAFNQPRPSSAPRESAGSIASDKNVPRALQALKKPFKPQPSPVQLLLLLRVSDNELKKKKKA